MPNRDPAPHRDIRYVGRRLFSLTGVVPLGAFLLVHVAINARALRGDAAFASAVRAIHRLPGLALVEWLLVFVPLLVHAAIGLWLIVTRTQFDDPSPYPNAMRISMRATGLAAIAFLALHLPALRFRAQGARLGGEELATALVADVSSTWHGVPWQGATYLIGAGCVTFHFAAGMWAFFVTTRGQKSRRARRWAAWGAAAAGAAIWMLFANIIVFCATGTGLFGATGEKGDQGAGAQCPFEGTPHQR